MEWPDLEEHTVVGDGEAWVTRKRQDFAQRKGYIADVEDLRLLVPTPMALP